MTAQIMRIPMAAFRFVPKVLVRHAYYLRKYGRWGEFNNPTRFSEFIQHRMLYDRTDRIGLTCDKLASKRLIAEKYPELRVADVLWSGDDIREIPLHTLPDRWVLKPNHSSQSVFFGNSDTELEEVRRATRGWNRPYPRIHLGEWAYSQAQRTLLVEEFIGSAEPPLDYKLFVFGGKVRFIQIDATRFTRHLRSFYSVGWDRLKVRNVFPEAPAVPKPSRLSEMIHLSEMLAEGFEFLRVDLYEVNDELWFGELTPYPGGGMEPFLPEEFDTKMGNWWKSALGGGAG